jgi:hypothetical protein
VKVLQFIRSKQCVDYLSMKMILNENCFNYEVVGIIEIYNFCIKFISI